MNQTRIINWQVGLSRICRKTDIYKTCLKTSILHQIIKSYNLSIDNFLCRQKRCFIEEKLKDGQNFVSFIPRSKVFCQNNLEIYWRAIFIYLSLSDIKHSTTKCSSYILFNSKSIESFHTKIFLRSRFSLIYVLYFQW